MTSNFCNFWYYVELTFALKTSAATTKTIKVINRPARAAFPDTDYIVGLVDLDGFANVQGPELPASLRGRIVLDDRRGVYSYERRISDFLDRYDIIGQTCKIYAARTNSEDADPTADFSQAWETEIKGWRRVRSSETLILETEFNYFKRIPITKSLNTNDFADLPDSSKGKHLPFVFGSNIEVRPIMLDANSNAGEEYDPIYGYATTLSTLHPVEGIQKYYARDSRGDYIEIASASAKTTAVLSNALNGNEKADSYRNSGDETERGYEIDFSGTSYAITDVDYYIDGLLAADQDVGQMTVTIYEMENGDTTVGRALGSASIDLNEYNSELVTFPAVTQAIRLTFPEPVIISDPNKSHLLAVKMPEDARGYLYPAVDDTNTAEIWVRAANGEWYKIDAAADSKPYYAIYAVEFDESTSAAGDADGLGYASVTAEQIDTGFKNTTRCDVTKLDLILEVNGIVDDASGTITGTPDALIVTPRYAVKLMTLEWNGSTWTDPKINTTQFSATNDQAWEPAGATYRLLNGATEGAKYPADIAAEVLKNGGGKLVHLNASTSGERYALWAWGDYQTAEGRYTDNELALIDENGTDVSSIVNRVRLFYDKRLRTVDLVTGSAEGTFRSYAGFYDWDEANGGIEQSISEESEDKFGSRPLADTAMNLISDDDSAAIMARYFATDGAEPRRIVTIEGPYFTLNSLEVMEVIDINHVDLPSFYGTSAQPKQPTYSESEAQFGENWDLRRAKTYRAQILSLEPNLRGYPTIKMKCRLITNPQDPNY